MSYASILICLVIGELSQFTSAVSVTIYEHRSYTGRQRTLEVNRCQNIPQGEKVSSIVTESCVVLYENPCCQGNAFRTRKNEPVLEYATNSINNVFSVSPCGAYRSESPDIITESWHGTDTSSLPIPMRKLDQFGDIIVYQEEKDFSSFKNWQSIFLPELWGYTKVTYGTFGPEDGPLFVFLHKNLEPSSNHLGSLTYMHGLGSCRNLVDVPITGNIEDDTDAMTREVGGIVLAGAKGVFNNPTIRLWNSDISPWQEIFTYDAYMQMGLDDDVERVHEEYSTTFHNFPRPESYWFRDWFNPIYERFGGSRVLNNYIDVLARHYPRQAGYAASYNFERRMNYGEMLHFFSASVGACLISQYKLAFGWDDVIQKQVEQAKRDFPGIQSRF